MSPGRVAGGEVEEESEEVMRRFRGWGPVRGAGSEGDGDGAGTPLCAASPSHPSMEPRGTRRNNGVDDVGVRYPRRVP
ncbi:hypothetical protein GCM10022377_22330 [Zhihengliuella alba]|uniref:Uncharacterized protein n=1 Tax=Zhihengliuella alba TaxID=547018 RepID=A0ABP7DU33_9MICC